MKFIHLSDLHIHRFGDNSKVEKTLAFIQKKYPKHHLIITGDLVDDADEVQFENARKYLTPFKGRLHFVPGNHDFGVAGNLYNRDRARRFDAILSGPLEQGGTFAGATEPIVHVVKEGSDTAMLIALDSNLETVQPFDFACGEIGEGQRKALQTILDHPASPDAKKILFFHHHLFINNHPFMELKDGRELMAAIYQRVDVVLFGHKHESNLWKDRCGIPYICAADNSPGKSFAREIALEKGDIRISDLPIA